MNNTSVQPSKHDSARPRSVLVPTNLVSTKDGVTVRARIDPTLPVTDVIRQLCISLKIQEPPLLFALRDDRDELVTDDNLRRMIRDKANLKLVSSPLIEATEILDRLHAADKESIKHALFSLQKYIREHEFTQEFLKRDGLRELLGTIESSSGNTLAYALNSMQNLMEHDYGWDNLQPSFIFRIVDIISNSNNPINVIRPATSILKRLVEADPRFGLDASGMPSSSVTTPAAELSPSPPPGSVYRYGFEVVWEQLQHSPNILSVVVSRLNMAESGMALGGMMLINSLLSNASDAHASELIDELERLNIRNVVRRLMASHASGDLSSSILDFQAHLMRITYLRKTTLVDVELPAVQAVLTYVWMAARLGNTGRPDKLAFEGEQWSLLGCPTGNMRSDFAQVGILGLDCLRTFVQADPDHFAKVILEQVSRPPSRRCPIIQASNEVVEILTEHWAIFGPGYSTSTSFLPFFLAFHRVHTIALRLFLRIWSESSAGADDFARVAALVQSQIKVALREENTRSWHEMESDFVNSEYRDIRERQMKELELTDDLLNKPPVRNLRAKLYKESYAFVRQQRIQCLMQGAWFVNGVPASSPSSRESYSAPIRPQRPWRFMRLDKTMRFIYYLDSTMKIPMRGGIEDLPERIEVASIAEVATGTCAVPHNVAYGSGDVTSPMSPLTVSPLSFSLVSERSRDQPEQQPPKHSLADQVAENASRFSDWTDGLNMLRKDGGHVATTETAEFVQALTEIGLKIKLLDLSGEKAEIPSHLPPGIPPSDTNFFFA
ncbi:engulfment and cell motility-like protein [Rhizoctonia solani AG-3 Rhs1AP]|uniref:Engulfment and cell motility-like protein n=1 Tax=Rhizoctonia solani AG-3 Rhs1AP TaxID=1086054 RepID=A0A0A1UMC0_9AGAM|nr:engulfment and cell motility-like protein [Rhizoctonia solani AG-3 Rhs1AP]